MKRASWRQRLLIPFLLPALLLYGAFYLYPAFNALKLSLTNLTGFIPRGEYVGLANFSQQVKDPAFIKALTNTIKIALGSTVLVFALAFAFAIAISHRSVRGKGFFRSLIFFPSILPGVAMGMLWIFIYSPNIGLLNGFLRAIGLDKLSLSWLGPDTALGAVIVALAWTFTGYYTVILLAGISRIPEDYYDAARVEGANELQTFFRITLPMIWDVLAMTLVMWIIFSLKTFEFVMVMTDGGPSNATLTLYIYIYRQAFGSISPIYKMGYAASIGITLLVVIVIATLLQRMLMHRAEVEY
jgi:ABC-type sugar transport system permease subunit